MRSLLLALVLLASCSSESDKPTRRKCVEAVAHETMIADLESLEGPSEFTADMAKELGDQPFESEDEAMTVIQVWERGSLEPKLGEGERRIAKCLSGSRRHAACVRRSTSLAEIGRRPA